MNVFSFIACEDLRHEVDGKVTLVGVFEGLSFPKGTKFPSMLRIATQLRVKFDEGETVPDQASVSYRLNGKDLATAQGTLTIIKRNQPIPLNMPMLVLPVDAPGVLTIEYTFRASGKAIGTPVSFEIPIELADVIQQLPLAHVG
jgi:hypothetical protein